MTVGSYPNPKSAIFDAAHTLFFWYLTAHFTLFGLELSQ